MPSVKCVRVDDDRSAAALEADGWRFVQTLVTYSIPSRERPEKRETLCPIAPWQREHYEAVSRLLPLLEGRLALDPEISLDQERYEKRNWLLPEDNVIVALHEGRPAGVIGFCKTLMDGETIVIDLIAVDPAYRIHGIGRALVAAVRRWAYQQDFREVRAGTSLENPAGCALYENQGFKEVKRQRTYHK